MPETARRWLVVAGCFMSVLTGPVLVASTFSVFFATLLQSEHWSRVGIAFAYSLYIVIYGLSGPVVGRWCERFGPKRVVLGGAALIAGGFALLGLTREVWQFCVLYGLLGVTAGMTGIVPLATLVFRWFASNRGLAIGVASSGTLGGLFLSPLAYFLIEQLGWRRAYAVLGIGAGLLLFATILATVGDTPEGTARERASAQSGEAEETRPKSAARDYTSSDLTLREAMGTQPFWLLTASGFLFLSALTGILAHAVPLALDRGLARSLAALSLGMIVGVGPAGRVGLGYMADRYPARKILVWSFILQGLAILLLLRGAGAALFWAFVILFAVAHGGALAVAPLVLNDLFGSTYLGSLVGAYWLMATAAGSLVGPALASAPQKRRGNVLSGLSGVRRIAILCRAPGRHDSPAEIPDDAPLTVSSHGRDRARLTPDFPASALANSLRKGIRVEFASRALPAPLEAPLSKTRLKHCRGKAVWSGRQAEVRE